MQAEEEISGGGDQGDAIGVAGEGDGVGARGPAGGVGDIRVLLQGVGAGVWPRDDDIVATVGDGEVGQAGRLHGADNRPEAAGEGVGSAGQRGAGIVLADGAAEGIDAAGARAFPSNI